MKYSQPLLKLKYQYHKVEIHKFLIQNAAEVKVQKYQHPDIFSETEHPAERPISG